MNSYKIWFTSDTHFQHFGIIKFQKERSKAMGITDDMTDAEKLKRHDEWLINMWNRTVGKYDHVYILGDFSFAPTEDTRRILSKLRGIKHLIVGNHDKSCKGLGNYFKTVSQIKEVPIKKYQYDFLEEDIYLVLCHFPLVAWNRRLHGALHIHGHTHNSISSINEESGELRVDIGIDSDIADFGLVSLENVYKFMKDKIRNKGFNSFKEYIENKSFEDGVRF